MQEPTYGELFVDNGPEDRDSTAASFDFDISSLNLPLGALVTVAANSAFFRLAR